MLRFPARWVGDTKVSSGICMGHMYRRCSVQDGSLSHGRRTGNALHELGRRQEGRSTGLGDEDGYPCEEGWSGIREEMIRVLCSMFLLCLIRD